MGIPEPFNRRRPHPWHGLETGSDAPEIPEIYRQEHALDVVAAAMSDYEDDFGG